MLFLVRVHKKMKRSAPICATLPARIVVGTRHFCTGKWSNSGLWISRRSLEASTDIIFQVVLWRLCSKLSLRDFAEMFLARGFEFTHETVREGEARNAAGAATTVIQTLMRLCTISIGLLLLLQVP